MQTFDSEELDLDPIATEGRDLFEEKGCIGCHATDSQNYAPGSIPVGPDLTQFADRSRFVGFLEPTKENLEDWLRDPEALKPGNLMTGTYGELSDDEIDKIAEYLLQLSPSDVSAADMQP